MIDESAGRVIEFDIKTPLTDEIIGHQIIAALKRDLPEADGDQLQSLTVVANGPSAHQAFKRTTDFPVLALNGALKLFTKRGLAPDYWACCDPQELVAGFLEDAPETTRYFVASKCHPAVFDALKGRDIRLWHIDDYPIADRRAVPRAVSITLCAMTLMNRLGYRHFDVYGWDACYIDGLHHASDDQFRALEPSDITLECDGKLFQTTHTWAAEVQDAIWQLAVADYDVTINGSGMVQAIREFRSRAA